MSSGFAPVYTREHQLVGVHAFTLVYTRVHQSRVCTATFTPVYTREHQLVGVHAFTLVYTRVHQSRVCTATSCFISSLHNDVQLNEKAVILQVSKINFLLCYTPT